MTELRDYQEFADGPLIFNINGKQYAHELSIEAGIELSAGLSGKDKSFAKKDGIELWQVILGPVYDELVADKVGLQALTRCGVTALAEAQYGRDYALAVWEAGADPKALEKYFRENGNRASRRSNSTGGANATRSRASTKATTARKR